jgi:hypothetical protein
LLTLKSDWVSASFRLFMTLLHSFSLRGQIRIRPWIRARLPSGDLGNGSGSKRLASVLRKAYEWAEWNEESREVLQWDDIVLSVLGGRTVPGFVFLVSIFLRWGAWLCCIDFCDQTVLVGSNSSLLALEYPDHQNRLVVPMYANN